MQVIDQKMQFNDKKKKKKFMSLTKNASFEQKKNSSH